jgi:tetratricopeptide (TPR) repeat protein
VSRTSWLAIPALLTAFVVANTDEAFAAPHGKVVLNDGREWPDVDYEQKGDRLYVKFPPSKGGFETDVAMSEVKTMTPTGPAQGPAQGGGGEEEAAPQAPSAFDWEGRFQLEPPPDWAVAMPTTPLMRALLRHATRDATLAVYVRQVSGPFAIPNTPRATVPKEVTDELVQQLSTRYTRPSNSRAIVATMHGAPVVRLEGGAVTELGATTPKRFTGVRFRAHGLEYSLDYVVSQADESALAASVDRLFEAFTFLPAVTHTDDTYSDYGRAFALQRPNADWQLLGAPFDDEAPVRVLTDGGRAELVVQLFSGTDAEQVVRGIMQKRRAASRHFKNDVVEEASQGGTTVKSFRFEDFNPGGRKALTFKGFAAALGGRVLVVTGTLPGSDEDARKLQGDIDAMLAGVRLWDADRIRRQLSTAQDATAFVNQAAADLQAKRPADAITKLDEALRLCPQFARALYLRGLAKRDTNDARGAVQDIEAAADLDPSAGYDNDLSTVYVRQALDAEGRKDWAEAVRLWVRIYRSQAGRTPDNLRKLTAAAGQLWTELKKDARQLDRGLKQVRTALRAIESDPGIATFLNATYRDGAGLLSRGGDFGKAKSWARDARNVTQDANQRRAAEQLLQQIEAAEERARAGGGR